MKKYTLSFGASLNYSHPAPDRTAQRSQGFNVTFQVWPNRESMAKSIRMQERRAPHPSDWKAVMPLSDGEGHGKPQQRTVNLCND